MTRKTLNCDGSMWAGSWCLDCPEFGVKCDEMEGVMKITVRVYDQWARVFKDGVQVKAYNLLSEDFAIALAEKHAGKLRKAAEERD